MFSCRSPLTSSCSFLISSTVLLRFASLSAADWPPDCWKDGFPPLKNIHMSRSKFFDPLVGAFKSNNSYLHKCTQDTGVCYTMLCTVCLLWCGCSFCNAGGGGGGGMSVSFVGSCLKAMLWGLSAFNVFYSPRPLYGLGVRSWLLSLHGYPSLGFFSWLGPNYLWCSLLLLWLRGSSPHLSSSHCLTLVTLGAMLSYLMIGISGV